MFFSGYAGYNATQSYIYFQERNDVGNHDNHRFTKKHFRVPAGRVVY